MTRMIRFLLCQSVLMAPAGEGGGSGGGSGGDDGKGAPAGGFTEDQTKAIGTMINGALTARLTRTTEDITKAFSTKLDDLAKALKPPEDDGKGKGEGKGGKGDPTPDTKMQAQIDELKTRLKASDDEKAAMKLRTERGEERAALEKGLADAGIKDGRLGGASALLFLDRAIVARKEDGSIGIKAKRTMGGQTFDEIVPIAEGIADWLKTDEGKSYLPPRAAGGSGHPFGGGVPGGNGKGADADKRAAATEVLFGHIEGGTGFGEAPDPRR